MSRAAYVRAAAAGIVCFGIGLGCGGSQPILGTVEDTAADLLLPVEQEIALGRELASQLAAELRLHPDTELQSYVGGLGARVVAAASDRDPRIAFSFHVVDDDATVNAFAIPGGHVYVYTGLLLAAENEAELMAVLSHEVAHVTQRHVAERFAATFGLQQAAAWALGDDAGTIAQLAAEIAATGVLLTYSRSAETEADRIGFRYLVRTDYDPQGFIWFFSKLDGSGVPEFLSSHPNPDNRVDAIQALIDAGSDWPARTGQADFDAMRNRI